MALVVTKVPRNLDSRLKLFGFELADLLLIFLYLSISNLIFGPTRLKFPVVWLGTIAIASVLYFVKRGKPDGYIQHLIQFKLRPTVFVAGAPDVIYRPLLQIDGDSFENRFSKVPNEPIRIPAAESVGS